VSFFTDEGRTLDLVTRLTEKFEEGAEPPWRVSDAPAAYLDRMLKAIVCFEVRVSSLDGAWKLSQGRPPQDIGRAAAGLRARGGAEDLDLADEMSRAGER
ncbi:MAG: FMN-binding negative transcriptional regulator, partial [Nitrososphaerota archaeon]|nr:FMN-binding negative transcriptional regulator [Nitrososphaerota archaeon]